MLVAFLSFIVSSAPSTSVFKQPPVTVTEVVTCPKKKLWILSLEVTPMTPQSDVPLDYGENCSVYIQEL